MSFFLYSQKTFGSKRILVGLLGSLGLSACATLPSSGPSGNQVQRSIVTANAGSSDPSAIRLIELEDGSSLPPAPLRPALSLPDLAPPATDIIGPGDILDIAIYESGVTLFGGGATKITADGAAFDASARAEKLLANRVDDTGNIRVPYAGRLHVAGRSVGEIEGKIRAALRGYSQNPQVLVTVREMITNSVIIAGEVNRPGRLVLPTNRETVSDAIALAGGYRGETKDLSVRLQRQGVTEQFRLNEAVSGDQAALRLYPGDRLSVLRAPQSFSVMGAPGRIELLPFGASVVSLAEAVAQAGGANSNTGDAQAIFVFRYVVNKDGLAQPVVYHINMMKAGSYFLSQRFLMQDKDVLYFGNARANQPSKLIQLISQLFSPIVTATSAATLLR